MQIGEVEKLLQRFLHVPGESQSKPGKNGLPRTMYRIKKAAAAICGWDRPLLTFIYPGFDCGSGA